MSPLTPYFFEKNDTIMTNIRQLFSDHMKKHRKIQGFTQRELAEKTDSA